jgi:hypothetical protein
LQAPFRTSRNCSDARTLRCGSKVAVRDCGRGREGSPREGQRWIVVRLVWERASLAARPCVKR